MSPVFRWAKAAATVVVALAVFFAASALITQLIGWALPAVLEFLGPVRVVLGCVLISLAIAQWLHVTSPADQEHESYKKQHDRHE
jgi:putative Mn2+ efflux pump MntP